MKVIIMKFPSVVLLLQGPVTLLKGSSSNLATPAGKPDVGVTGTFAQDSCSPLGRVDFPAPYGLWGVVEQLILANLL